MHLATRSTGDGPRPVLLDPGGGRVIDLPSSPGAPSSVRELLAAGPGALEAARHHAASAAPGEWRPLSEVTLGPPVPDPGKIVCLGRNYAEHAAEGNAPVPEHPMYFLKPRTCLIGTGHPIEIPAADRCVDYEGELVVVIGRSGREIPAERAHEHVAGYTIGNDVSARTWQRRTAQFAAGKMADTFGPTGPAVVTADEVPDPQDLRIRTVLNGETMQDGSTSDMVFDVATIIADLSRMTTLEPGDLIFTGTPDGVGFARTPPVWLTPGDVVTVTITGLGELTNPVR